MGLVTLPNDIIKGFLRDGEDYAKGSYVYQNDKAIVDMINGGLDNTNIKPLANIAPAKIAGTAVTLSGAETISNKTITNSTINGSTINETSIGATTPSTGKFTTLESTGAASLSRLAVNRPEITSGTLDVLQKGTTNSDGICLQPEGITTYRQYIDADGLLHLTRGSSDFMTVNTSRVISINNGFTVGGNITATANTSSGSIRGIATGAGHAVRGVADNGYAGYFAASGSSGNGVFGNSPDGYGVYGVSTNYYGVRGVSTNSWGGFFSSLLLSTSGVTILGSLASSATPVANAAYRQTQVKAWVQSSSTGSIGDSHNVSSVSRISTGIYTVNLRRNFSVANFCFSGVAYKDITGTVFHVSGGSTASVSSFSVFVTNPSGTVTDRSFSAMAIGNQ